MTWAAVEQVRERVPLCGRHRQATPVDGCVECDYLLPALVSMSVLEDTLEAAERVGKRYPIIAGHVIQLVEAGKDAEADTWNDWCKAVSALWAALARAKEGVTDAKEA